MSSRVALFWPGDYRGKPNEWARPSIESATRQLENALRKLGRTSYRTGDFLTRPHEAIETLGPIDDPLIGVCVHWFYGPHTTDGVVGKNNPLLLASNFSGQWPGLVGLLNTGACLESVGREFSRVWTCATDWTADETFMARLDEWCKTGRIRYDAGQVREDRDASALGNKTAQQVLDGIRRRRILALMLGDTSMGMINGYFGHRLLNLIGFTEHKVDQTWIIERGRRIDAARIDAAFRFVREKGVTFHWRGEGCPASIAGDAADFTEDATREQLRDYLAVLDLVHEFKADCIGWQYQLGLLPLRPPSDFSEGLLNSVCRPESDGDLIITSTEADQGNLVPMELMKRLLKAKGLHPAVMFHDVRWGAPHDGRFLWVLLNSGSCGAYAFNHDPDSLRGVHSYRQPSGYFPIPGGTFAGESRPGKITWARAWLNGSGGGNGELWMDVGRGEVMPLPEAKRDAWWEGTTRQWPFMAADLGVRQETVMAHYMSNHIAVAYGDIFEEMKSLSGALGFRVRTWGNR
ncbi:MAG: fucose isomerase [Planctomycetes bacterium]|nr:fucose isomerase [Planctomycetota bacterium]